MGVESRSPPPASRRLRLAGRSLPGQRQLLAQAHWDPRLSLCIALSHPNPLFLPDIFHLLSPIFPHAASPPSFSPLSLLPSSPTTPRSNENLLHHDSSSLCTDSLSSLPISRRVANLFLRVLLSHHSLSLSLCSAFLPFSTPPGNRYDRVSLRRPRISIRREIRATSPPAFSFSTFPPILASTLSLRRSSDPVIAVTGFSE